MKRLGVVDPGVRRALTALATSQPPLDKIYDSAQLEALDVKIPRAIMACDNLQI